MLVRFRPDVIALKPKVVVILAGINDIAENTGPIAIETIFGNIVSMIELARANQIRVVVSSVLPTNIFPWRQHIKPADKVLELNSLLKAYCKQKKLVYLDYYSVMVDSEKGLNQKYTSDGVHPTLTGYQVMEPMVEAAIKKAMRKRR
jgi:lysophospholipase L1-like esterase